MAWSRCTVCELDFSSLSSFDKHLKGVANPEHLNPADVGLEFDGSVWKQPDNGQFDKLKNGVRSGPKVFDCAGCGNPFQNTPGRGRPPKRCTNCGGKGIPLEA